MAVTPYPVIPARIGHSSGLRLVPEEQQQANAEEDDLLAGVAIDAVGEPLEACVRLGRPSPLAAASGT